MQIIYEDFKSFKDEKPNDFQTCLVLWDGKDKSIITVGIYYSEKKAFFDGIGGWLDERCVRMWIDAENYIVR